MSWYCESCDRYQETAKGRAALQPDLYGKVRYICQYCCTASITDLPRCLLERNRRGETVVNGLVKRHVGAL